MTLVPRQLDFPGMDGLPCSNQGSQVLIIIEAQVGTGLACPPMIGSGGTDRMSDKKLERH